MTQPGPALHHLEHGGPADVVGAVEVDVAAPAATSRRSWSPAARPGRRRPTRPRRRSGRVPPEWTPPASRTDAGVGDVGRHGEDPHPVLARLLRHPIGRLRLGHVAEAHVEALLGEPEHDRSADPPGAAGDQRDPAIVMWVIPPRRWIARRHRRPGCSRSSAQPTTPSASTAVTSAVRRDAEPGPGRHRHDGHEGEGGARRVGVAHQVGAAQPHRVSGRRTDPPAPRPRRRRTGSGPPELATAQTRSSDSPAAVSARRTQPARAAPISAGSWKRPNCSARTSASSVRPRSTGPAGGLDQHHRAPLAERAGTRLQPGPVRGQLLDRSA